ncbi:hypothetical protein DIPPA_13003 [Diplonema papillatum]|nr:hypothetical protein DIPPA_13003 [Diplonema papillatum]
MGDERKLSQIESELEAMQVAVESVLGCPMSDDGVVDAKVRRGENEGFGITFSNDLLIQEVASGSPAHRCGISKYKGWVISHVGAEPVTSPGALSNQVRGKPEVTFHIVRVRDPAVAKAPAEEQQKKILADLVLRKRDHSGQIECLLHWIEKYEKVNEELQDRADRLRRNVEAGKVEVSQLRKLKKQTGSSRVGTLMNFVNFSSGDN